jgi:hypothetical protein
MKDPTRLGYQNLLNQVVGGLSCVGSLSINKCMNHYANIGPMQSQGHDKCLFPYLNSNYMSFPWSLAK